MSDRKLVKISSEAKVFGVCAGVGRYLSVDPTMIRIGFVLASVFGVGSPILIYIILALIMPKR